MIIEAIILAGGLGTRLRSVVQDVPKCLAPVHGTPFLDYVIRYAIKQGVQHFILSLGYKGEMVKDFVAKQNYPVQFSYCMEEEPLGTGGAIQKSLQMAKTKQVLVLNGDTFYMYPLEALSNAHNNYAADCTVCLKPMQNFNRYGAVLFNVQFQIQSFKEKEFMEEGLINTGVYILEKEEFLAENLPEKFSFEKNYLAKTVDKQKCYGYPFDAYFIDIGIPEDFEKAQNELKIHKIITNKNSALFLDRDGVLNQELPMDYVKTLDEFILFPEAIQAVRCLSLIFNKIFIVTNQKGVGRQLMTEKDLETIHAHLLKSVQKEGGRIDQIYYCTALENEAICRKPNPGMAFQAKADHPEIELSKSVMVGNNMSDMQFGKNAGMQTIFVTTTNLPYDLPNPYIDIQCKDLAELAQLMQQIN